MIEEVLRYGVPQAYELLPPAMRSTPATALVLAIGLQESRFLERRQKGGGPARSFWQFEIPGTAEVLRNARTAVVARQVLGRLRYARLQAPEEVLEVLEHNDALAAAWARLRLWCLPQRLPGRDEVERAWRQYLQAWLPGKPHPETWAAFYDEAWERAVRAHESEDGTL